MRRTSAKKPHPNIDNRPGFGYHLPRGVPREALDAPAFEISNRRCIASASPRKTATSFSFPK
jgi:hypothetical protein